MSSKRLRRAALAVFVVGVLAVGALAWLRGNLDRLVRDAIVGIGSELLQAPVSVEAVQIGLVDGRGEIRGLVIGNPPGFRTPYALKAGSIELQIELASLTREVVTVRKLTVVAPELIYEKADGRTNLDAIQAHIARSRVLPATAAGPGQGKKLIIDSLTLREVRARASIGPMAGRTIGTTLPDISLRDIGRAQGGATPAEVGQAVAQAMAQRLRASLGLGVLSAVR